MLYLLTVGDLHVCVLRNELQAFCSLLSQIWQPCNDIQNRGWVTLSLARHASEMDEGYLGLDEKSMTDSGRRVLYEHSRWLLIPTLTLFVLLLLSLLGKFSFSSSCSSLGSLFQCWVFFFHAGMNCYWLTAVTALKLTSATAERANSSVHRGLGLNWFSNPLGTNIFSSENVLLVEWF